MKNSLLKTLLLVFFILIILVLDFIKPGIYDAGTASILEEAFTTIGLSKNAHDYHFLVERSANSNDTLAITNLCLNNLPLTTNKEKLLYCQKVINNTTQINSNDGKLKFYRDMALAELFLAYSEQSQPGNLIQLCKQTKTKHNKDLCMAAGTMLADKLAQENKDKELTKLYETLVNYDDTGITQSLLADRYLAGQGTNKNISRAIFWYKKSLKHNYSNEMRSSIINNLCIAYEKQHRGVKSFLCFKTAAELGYPLSQMNLAINYITINDYKSAYAWISAAIAKGFENKSLQGQAEKIKNILEEQSQKEDKKDIEKYKKISFKTHLSSKNVS